MDSSIGITDVLKKSIFDLDFANSLSLGEILSVLLVTFIMGMWVFYIYKLTFQGVLYTQTYNVSLVMIGLVTSLVIMTISTNIILSLGMVGALSIVRFRTAIKDSMDIVFMFWSISIGIANGAGFFKLSIAGLIVISLALVLLTKYKSRSNPYLLIVNYENNDQRSKEILGLLRSRLKYAVVKSKSIKKGFAELAIEVRINQDEHELIDELSRLDYVTTSTLVAYNGDYIS